MEQVGDDVFDTLGPVLSPVDLEDLRRRIYGGDPIGVAGQLGRPVPGASRQLEDVAGGLHPLQPGAKLGDVPLPGRAELRTDVVFGSPLPPIVVFARPGPVVGDLFGDDGVGVHRPDVTRNPNEIGSTGRHHRGPDRSETRRERIAGLVHRVRGHRVGSGRLYAHGRSTTAPLRHRLVPSFRQEAEPPPPSGGHGVHVRPTDRGRLHGTRADPGSSGAPSPGRPLG